MGKAHLMDNGVTRRMQRQSYQSHIQRLRGAYSRVDHRSPSLPAKRLAGFDVLLADTRTYLQRTKENVHMLLNLSRTMRTMGDINAQMNNQHLRQHSALPNIQLQLSQLERQNIELGKRILNAKLYGSSDGPPYQPRKRQASIFPEPASQPGFTSSHSISFNESNAIFAKYDGWDLQLPSDNIELMRLLRPRILLHFGALDGRPLGEVVVQLYTEAAPLIVLEFVRKCMARHSHEFAVRRIFPQLWMEAYLQGTAMPLNAPLEFDTRVLDHGRYPYVLSCAKEYCQEGFAGGAINFTISFKPLSVSNGRRVGFGRVLRGDKVIDCMQSHGTKNGKISKPLVITYCDVL